MTMILPDDIFLGLYLSLFTFYNVNNDYLVILDIAVLMFLTNPDTEIKISSLYEFYFSM